MAKTNVRSVDDYIASQPEDVRPILERVRGAIRKAIPKAEEVISYQIPTYNLHGDAVIYFAGWKQHYSLYPVSARMVTELRASWHRTRSTKAQSVSRSLNLSR